MGLEEISVVEVKFIIKDVQTYDEYKNLRKVLHGTNLEEVAAKVMLETLEESPELRDKLGIKVEFRK